METPNVGNEDTLNSEIIPEIGPLPVELTAGEVKTALANLTNISELVRSAEVI